MYETGILKQSDAVFRGIKSFGIREQKQYEVFKKIAFEIEAQKWKVLKMSQVKSYFQLLGFLHVIVIVRLIVELRQLV